MTIRRGELDPGGHQQRRPDHGVELEDVLGEDVQVGGPEAVGQVLAVARVGERRVVVEEGVEPDVHHLARDPTAAARPSVRFGRDSETSCEPALDERERLVAAEVGHDEVGPLLVEPLELGSWNEESRKNQFSSRSRSSGISWIGQVLPGPELGLGLEVGAARAVPALVGPLVDVPVVVDALHHLLDPRDVLAGRRCG